MERVFKKISIVEKRKAEKLLKINKKLPVEEWEEPKLCDYVVSEQSLADGFESVFGARCDIMAKLLYIKCSGHRDFVKVNMVEFYSMFK